MADEYADDFEEYQDDFEEVDAKPRPPTAQSGPTASSRSTDVGTSSIVRGGFESVPARAALGRPTGEGGIGFAQDQYATSELPSAGTGERYQDRLRLGAIKQASSQAPGERISVATSCERPIVTDAVAQVPDDLGQSLLPASTTTAGRAGDSASATSKGTQAPLPPPMSDRAVGFLRCAALVCERLCEENLLVDGSSGGGGGGGDKKRAVVAGSPLIRSPPSEPFLQSRQVLCCASSPIRVSDLAIAYGPPALAPVAPAARECTLHPPFDRCCVIVVQDGEGGVKYALVCHGKPSCLTFSSNAQQVVAGTHEGTLLFWDLTEPHFLHAKTYGATPSGAPLTIASGLRWPSYSTAAPGDGRWGGSGVSSLGALSGSPIRSVCRPSALNALHPSLAAVATAHTPAPDVSTSSRASTAASSDDGYVDDFEGGGGGGAGTGSVSARSRAHTGASTGTADGRTQPRKGRLGPERRTVPVFGAGLSSLLHGADEVAAVISTASDSATGGQAAALPQQFVCIDDAGVVEVWVSLTVSSSSSSSSSSASGTSTTATAGGWVGGGSGVGSSVANGGAKASQRGSKQATDTAAMVLSDRIDESDLGRGVTSTCKLAKVTRWDALSEYRRRHRVGVEVGVGSPSQPCAYEMDVCPTDPTRVLICYSDGRILHASRLGEALTPDKFLPPNAFEDGGLTGGGGSSALTALSPPTLANAAATSVSYNPFLPKYFLAGFGDGTVALFSTTTSQCLRAWSAPWSGFVAGAKARQQSMVGVAKVRWIPTRPGAFFALNECGWLAVWDLHTSMIRPVASLQLKPSWGSAAGTGASGGGDGEDARVIAVEVVGGNDISPRVVNILCTFTNGVTMVVTLDPGFSWPMAGEVDLLEALVRAA